MNTRKLLSLVVLLNCFAAFGVNVKAYFSYSVFNTPEKGPYVETYLTIPGSSVVFKREKGKYQASVNIVMTFKKNNEIVKTTSYNLHSLDVADTTERPNIIDQQRFSLPNGKYEYEYTILDNNAPAEKKFSESDSIDLNIVRDKIQISDIQLVESFSKSTTPSVLTKSGYDLIPYSVNYYPNEMTKLAFYSEAYNTDTVLGQEKKFLLVYYIESYETLEKIEGYYAHSKQVSAKVNVVLSQFDIQSLTTGSYNLVVELRDEKNVLRAQKKHEFQRLNKTAKIAIANIAAVDPNNTFVSKYTNKDSLREFIACVWPISSSTEREWQNNQIKNADIKAMQQYIYAFWKNRNDANPEGEWSKYYQQVIYVKKTFSIGKVKGYYTDRGRVYLQYGAPNARQQVPNEPESYPYEIWQYYRIVDPATGQMQTNKKFVFYNRELDGSNFKLLHSDARGETKDARWQIKLKQRTTQELNLDVEKPKNSNYGSGADDLFSSPR